MPCVAVQVPMLCFQLVRFREGAVLCPICYIVERGTRWVRRHDILGDPREQLESASENETDSEDKDDIFAHTKMTVVTARVARSNAHIPPSWRRQTASATPGTFHVVRRVPGRVDGPEPSNPSTRISSLGRPGPDPLYTKTFCLRERVSRRLSPVENGCRRAAPTRWCSSAQPEITAYPCFATGAGPPIVNE